MPANPHCTPHSTYPASALLESQVTALFPLVDESTLRDDLTKLTSFHSRYFRSQAGRDAALWIQSRLQSSISSKNEGSSNVSLFEHSWKQPSVVARIQGKSNRTIILSTHIDSLNLYLPSLLSSPGADDNASGTTALLTIFSLLQQYIHQPSSTPSPLNTLEFHFYSAEEAGFWGSSDLLSTYNARHRQIHSLLQFDMVGYTPPSSKEPHPIGVVTDYTHPPLSKYISILAETYFNPHRKGGGGGGVVETTCGYACSDHASAMRFGYAGGLVTAGRMEDLSNSYSHTWGDNVGIINFGQLANVTRLGLAFAVEMAWADLNGGGSGDGVDDDGMRGYVCDTGYPDGWSGWLRRFAAARAADPLGLGLWYLVLLVLLLMIRPWEEFGVKIPLNPVVWVRRGWQKVYAIVRRRRRRRGRYELLERDLTD